MKNLRNNRRNKNALNELLGEATPIKASGLAYTLVAVMPVALSVFFVIVIGSLGLMKEGVENKDWFLYSNFLLPQIAFILVAFCCFKWTKTPLKSYIQNQKTSLKYFILAIILQFGLLSLSELNTLFLKLLGNIGYQDGGVLLPSMDGLGFVGVFIVVAIMPAILEEVIFRGVLLKGLRAFGDVWAIVLCGGLFALYHQNPAQTLYQFCCGMCFALIAIKSGSILPTVVSHFFNNGLILILVKLGVTSFVPTAQWGIIVVCLLCLIASLFYLIFVDKKGACTQRNKKIDGNARKDFCVFSAVGVLVCALSWLITLINGIIGK